MHDTTDGSHWHEPEGLKNAGYGAWKRPNTPYDDYMEAQGVPIYRGIGVRRVQDLPLKRWNRMWQRNLHSALRHRGPLGLLRGRGARRGRAQSRASYVRGDHGGRRRPWHDRDLDRRSE